MKLISFLCGLDNLFKNLEKLKFETDFFNKIAVLKGHAVSVSFVNDGGLLTYINLLEEQEMRWLMA